MNMELMQELIEATRVSKKAAAAVYHRDYERTKNKPYRKYDPADHKKSTEEEEESIDVDDDQPVNEGAKNTLSRIAKRSVGKINKGLSKIAKIQGRDDMPNDTLRDKRTVNNAIKKMSSDQAEEVVKNIRRQQKNNKRVDEGAWDFIKGAAHHVGNNVKQAVGNVVQAGQTQSAIGDLDKSVAQLAKLLATYDQLKAGQQKQPPQQEIQPPQFDQQRPNPARQRVSSAPQGKPSDAVPAAFRATTKPRIRNGEFVFSSYLQQHDGDFISEGAWDFLKGAAGHVGNNVKQAVGNAVQAGREASSAADYKNTVQQAKQTIQNIAGLIRKLGEQGMNAFKQSLQNSGMNPLMQQRIYKLVLNAFR